MAGRRAEWALAPNRRRTAAEPSAEAYVSTEERPLAATVTSPPQLSPPCRSCPQSQQGRAGRLTGLARHSEQHRPRRRPNGAPTQSLHPPHRCTREESPRGEPRAATPQVLPLSIDHKPDRADECARITAAGGWVAGGRVMRALAVSRAIGDRDFKRGELGAEEGLPFSDSLVVPDPEVRIARVQEGDELLLACDGLWDVMGPEEAFRFLSRADAANAPQKAIEHLARAAEIDFSSGDNITAVYARL